MDFFDILLAKKLEDDRDPTIEGLSVTENGIYSEENKAYNPVIVEVPEPTLITKSITANGTYSASADNADGYSSVTVAVDGFKKKSIANTPTDIASFNDGTANPMPSLGISIEPVQDLHGYDNPWVGGAGKNKLPSGEAKTVTLNGATITSDGNGAYTFSGIATAASSPIFNCDEFVIPDFNNATIYFMNNVYIDFVFLYNNTVVETWSVRENNRKSTYSAMRGKTCNKIQIGILSGTNYNGGKISPMICDNGNETTFAPYENICPISGHTEADVTVTDDLTTPTETHTLSIPFHDNSDNPVTVYGGTLNVTTGELRVTMANIASYNGETINEPWISSMDAYSAGTTPTTGAQVVYPLATPQTYQLTPTQVSTLLGQNNIFADCGQVLDGEYFVTL